MHFARLCAVLMLALATVSVVSAQKRTLTLEQARQAALELNLNVAQAQNNIESAQAGVLAATGNYLPTLSASGGWTRSQNEVPVSGSFIDQNTGRVITAGGTTVGNTFSTGLSLNYTLFNGLSREGLYTQASANAVATEQRAARTRQSVVFQVETAYLNVLRREQLVKVSEENLKRDERQLERITESNRVGSASRADVYRQQSQVAADELSVINAQNDYDKAKADLIALIGLNVAEEFEIADPSLSSELAQSDIESQSRMTDDFKSLVNRAIGSRPDYQSAMETVRATEGSVTSARSGYFPSISTFAGYGINGDALSRISNNKNLNWGINIRWNLFDGFNTNNQLQSAQVQYKNAELSLQQTERTINVEVKKAMLDLEAARKAFDVTQKGLLSAREDRKIAEERYNLGAGTLLDLLIANASLVSAEANKVNAVYDYIIAKRNVDFAVGEKAY